MSVYEVMIKLNEYARIMQQELDKQLAGSVGAERLNEFRRTLVYAAGLLANPEAKRLIERGEQ